MVEREGFSLRHPARFVLVGSGNPEEGDLRPQLLDRFGLHARIRTLHDAWVVMRRGRGRELFVILERAGDTLLEASEATDRFCESLDFETF